MAASSAAWSSAPSSWPVHDLGAGRDLRFLKAGHLDLVREQPVNHVSPALLTGTGVRLARPGGQLQVHIRIEVHPQDHRRLARIVPGDDLAAGDRVPLASLGHPGTDLVLKCAVVSHAMSLAAMLPRALIAWLRQ